MREVAWVIFDEIHYMRDSGILCVPLFFSINLFFFHQEHFFFLLKNEIFILSLKISHLCA